MSKAMIPSAVSSIGNMAGSAASQAASGIAQAAKAATAGPGIFNIVGEGLKAAAPVVGALAGKKKQPDMFNPINAQNTGPAPIMGGGQNPISPLQRNNLGGERYQAVSDLLGGM